MWHNLDSMEIHKSKEIKDYCVANHISTVNHYSVQNIYKTKSNLLMVIDSMGIYNVRHFKPQFIDEQNFTTTAQRLVRQGGILIQRYKIVLEFEVQRFFVRHQLPPYRGDSHKYWHTSSCGPPSRRSNIPLIPTVKLCFSFPAVV